MTSDIESSAAKELENASVQKDRPVGQTLQANLLKSVAIAVPVAVAVFVGLVALAVRNQDPDWAAYLSMAAGIGAIAGVFFGLLTGFMRSTHLFDD